MLVSEHSLQAAGGTAKPVILVRRRVADGAADRQNPSSAGSRCAAYLRQETPAGAWTMERRHSSKVGITTSPHDGNQKTGEPARRVLHVADAPLLHGMQGASCFEALTCHVEFCESPHPHLRASQHASGTEKDRRRHQGSLVCGSAQPAGIPATSQPTSQSLDDRSLLAVPGQADN